MESLPWHTNIKDIFKDAGGTMSKCKTAKLTIFM
jgi:hypothetical protein